MSSTSNSFDTSFMAKPPKICRDKFPMLKNRMVAFLNGIDYVLLDTIRDGPYILKIFVTTTNAPIISTTPAPGVTQSSLEGRYEVKERSA